MRQKRGERGHGGAEGVDGFLGRRHHLGVPYHPDVVVVAAATHHPEGGGGAEPEPCLVIWRGEGATPSGKNWLEMLDGKMSAIPSPEKNR